MLVAFVTVLDRMGSKYYVVWRGRIPGVYLDWQAAKAQVEGFRGAKYKSYQTQTEARAAFDQGVSDVVLKPDPVDWRRFSEVDSTALAVDAACSGNPGKLEYRGVWLDSGVEWFHKGPFQHGTNNIGEFLALVHAMALMEKQNKLCLIYTDSETAIAWIRNRKVKSQLEKSNESKSVWDLIDRAEKWLVSHDVSQFRIVKWKTEQWGEIPADFGRK